MMRLVNDFRLGINKARSVPMLPEKVLAIHNSIYARGIRVLGGVSGMILLSHRLDHIQTYELKLCAIYICVIILVMYFIYSGLYINYHRFFHIRNLFNNGDLEVRNSPLNYFGTKIAKTYACLKGFCDSAVSFTFIITGATGFDELRKAKGLEPYFIPKIADAVMPLTGQEKDANALKAAIAENKANCERLKQNEATLNEINKLHLNGEINEEISQEIKNEIKKHSNQLLISRNISESRILQEVKNPHYRDN